MNTSFNIFDKPVELFLDGVDRVLNSNTFLFSFDLKGQSIQNAVRSFIFSETFLQQILQQDIDRQWHNMHAYDEAEGVYKPKPGALVKENCLLTLSGPRPDKQEYLMAMLTGDTTKGSFYSFYNTKLKRDEALGIVTNLVDYIFGREQWELFMLEPTFLWSAEEVQSNTIMSYFEGDYANDSATVLATGTNGFIILTNGID